MNAAPPQAQWISFAIAGVAIALVLAFRLRGMRRDRRLRIEQLWIVPALYGALTAFLFWRFPPTGVVWAICGLALAIGAALGWQRGRMMEIKVDPDTHAINQRTSPAAMIFIVVLLLVRQGARQLEEGGSLSLHLNAIAVTDVLVAFALGLLAVQRLEMYLRARRLLEAARLV